MELYEALGPDQRAHVGDRISEQVRAPIGERTHPR